MERGGEETMNRTSKMFIGLALMSVGIALYYLLTLPQVPVAGVDTIWCITHSQEALMNSTISLVCLLGAVVFVFLAEIFNNTDEKVNTR